MEEITEIVVVEDQQWNYIGLVDALGDVENIKVIDRTDSADEALGLTEMKRPGMVIFDIKLKGDKDGVSLFKLLKDKYPDIKYIAWTNSNAARDIIPLVEMNVDAIILKNEHNKNIIFAIKEVLEGEQYFSPDVIRLVSKSKNKDVDNSNILTKRETQVLELAADGLSCVKTGEKLHIGKRTIESYRSNIISKLEAENLAHAIKIAFDKSILKKKE